MKTGDLEKQLRQLNSDLNEYSFNVEYLDDSEKEKIKGLYKILWKTYNQKIFIENLSGVNIRVTDKIYVNNIVYINNDVNNKTTLYFSNCKHINILINSKVCHITVENCNYVNIKTREGSITGIDNLNCKHVCHVLENSAVYFIDVSNSEGCTFYISEDNALDTIISSYGSPDIKFILTCPEKGIIKNKFIPGISFFEIYRLYNFEKMNGIIQLSYITQNLNSQKRTVYAQK